MCDTFCFNILFSSAANFFIFVSLKERLERYIHRSSPHYIRFSLESANSGIFLVIKWIFVGKITDMELENRADETWIRSYVHIRIPYFHSNNATSAGWLNTFPSRMNTVNGNYLSQGNNHIRDAHFQIRYKRIWNSIFRC